MAIILKDFAKQIGCGSFRFERQRSTDLLWVLWSDRYRRLDAEFPGKGANPSTLTERNSGQGHQSSDGQTEEYQNGGTSASKEKRRKIG